MNVTASDRDPEHGAFDREVSAVLETAIEALPEAYRSVFVLREMEDLSTAETAECLELTEQTVKTRLHRARGLLRRHLLARVGTATATSFAFAGARCDRMVASVLARIGASSIRPRALVDTTTPSIH